MWCVLLRLCSSTATCLVVWGWCAGTEHLPQAWQPGAHNKEHRTNTTLFRLTNSTLQNSSDWAAHLLPSPDLVYPASLPMSFGPTCTLSLSITPDFSHFLSSPVQTTANFRTSWLSPTHPTLSLVPTHFSSLYFIWSLFKSSSPPLHSQNLCAWYLCHSSLYTVTSSIAYPVFLLHNTQFFHRAYWKLHRCGGIWRKQAPPDRRWCLYTNQRGITVIYFPLMNSTHDQQYSVTRLLLLFTQGEGWTGWVWNPTHLLCGG